MFVVLKSVLGSHHVGLFCEGTNSRSDEVAGRCGRKEVSKYLKQATNNT